MKKPILLLILVFCCLSKSYSQDTTAFKPSGKIIARSFFDYSTDFDKESGFDLTRAFLGYKYQITPNFSGQVIIDGAAGKKDDRFEVYIRSAFINWHEKQFNVNAGLTNLLQFNLQENYWKHRYVLNSHQDLNQMAPSVDLGLTAEYKFNKYISADLSFTNGQGYKEIKKSGSKRYAIGTTLHPLKNFVFRAYTDIYNESKELRCALPEGVSNAKYKNQYTLSLFAGYRNKFISGGAEYNKVFNKGFIEKRDCYGYSFYSSIKIHPKFRFFARYDITDSNTPSSFIEPWNDSDGQLMIAGIEFKPLKQLKIAPNFRNLNPNRDKSKQYLFINVEFNL